MKDFINRYESLFDDHEEDIDFPYAKYYGEMGIDSEKFSWKTMKDISIHTEHDLSTASGSYLKYLNQKDREGKSYSYVHKLHGMLTIVHDGNVWVGQATY